MGLQYYLEHRLHHDAYHQSLSQLQPVSNENRNSLSLRLTQWLRKRDFRLSLFLLFSPSDGDAYLRPTASYRINDKITVDGGANWFYGDRQHTMFGQFRNNSNIYIGVRYGLSY